jgi:PLP dependent protein
MIAGNLMKITQRISEAAARAGRSPEDVRIVAAGKKQGVDKIREAVDAGIRIIGHNYVQEAAAEADAVKTSGVEVHMIGHVQRNKAGKVVELFDVIQTVDDVRLVETLNRRANAIGKVVGVMIQASLAGEAQKSGVTADSVEKLADAIRSLPSLKLKGLMTMPPFFDDPEGARPYFVQLRELRDRLMDSGTLTSDMGELSMGMTGDFEAAVEEGATLVRIGTALFGPRV